MKMEQTYECPATARGVFYFNDHVCMEFVMAPIEKRTGRLLQVRKGVGQFGSDMYILRLRDGGLCTFENCLMRKVEDVQFVQNFYRENGRTPPMIPFQAEEPEDSVGMEYTINHNFPETGFVIEKPAQPPSASPAFSICVINKG